MQLSDFNPYSPEFDADPYPVYQFLRENHPIYYWPTGRAWVVSRFEDVEAVLRDSRFSLSYRDWEFAASDPNRELMSRLAEKGLTELPAIDHHRIRKLVNPAFTPSAVAQLRKDIQEIVDDTLVDLCDRDEIDVVKDFANYIPLRLVSRLFRIPHSMSELFTHFSTAIIESTNPWLDEKEFGRILAVILEGVPVISNLIEDRRKHPGDDLLSTLIHVEEQGEMLSHEELLALMCAMLAGAVEPTAHLIGFGVLNLLRFPDQFQLLRREPSLIKNAIEEVLRFDNSGKSSAPRYAQDTIQLQDVTIHKGQMVYPLLASALRDPRVFPNPDTFDIRRDLSRSMPFGHGAHHCLGAALGRLEGIVAVSTLVQRFPDMQITGAPQFAPHAYLRNLVSLPIRLNQRSPTSLAA